MKQQFILGIAGTIRLTAYDRNRPLIPTSATIILYKNDGNTVLQSSVAVTNIDGNNGEMIYNLTTTHTASLGLNYKAVWTYVISGSTYYETQLFDVVRSILSVPITDDDLYNELPSLKKANVQASGTATSADVDYLSDSIRRKEDDDYWKGGVLEILAGTGAGQQRDVTTSVQSSGGLGVTPNFTTTPSTDSVYRVVKSWSRVIEQCFEKIEQMLYDKGKRDALILESSQIRIPLIYLTLHTIAIDLRNEESDKWDLIQRDYNDKFKQAFSNMTLDYDEDESGGVQGQEVQTSLTSLRIGRS